jgi:hypothetical protein
MPRSWRDFVAATLLAALAPVILAACLLGTIRIMPLALAITLAHAIVLGLPICFVIDAMGRLNVLSAMAVGAAVGAIPLGIFSSLAGGDATPIALLGSLGALAGFVFWLTLKLGEWLGTTASLGGFISRAAVDDRSLAGPDIINRGSDIPMSTSLQPAH